MGMSWGPSPPSTGTHDPRLAHTSWKVPPCAALVPGSRGVCILPHRGLCLRHRQDQGTFSWSSSEGQSVVRQQHHNRYTPSHMLRFTTQICLPTLLGGHQEAPLLKRQWRRGWDAERSLAAAAATNLSFVKGLMGGPLGSGRVSLSSCWVRERLAPCHPPIFLSSRTLLGVSWDGMEGVFAHPPTLAFREPRYHVPDTLDNFGHSRVPQNNAAYRVFLLF